MSLFPWQSQNFWWLSLAFLIGWVVVLNFCQNSISHCGTIFVGSVVGKQMIFFSKFELTCRYVKFILGTAKMLLEELTGLVAPKKVKLCCDVIGLWQKQNSSRPYNQHYQLDTEFAGCLETWVAAHTKRYFTTKNNTLFWISNQEFLLLEWQLHTSAERLLLSTLLRK